MEENNYALLTDPDMKEIFQSFIVETREIFEKLDVDLVTLESKSDDLDFLNQVFRHYHTIKGTSGFLGLEKMTNLTHRCEDLLNKLRKGEVKLDNEIMDVLWNGYDDLKGLLKTIETHLNENYDIKKVINRLDNLLAKLNNEKPEEAETRPSVPEAKPIAADKVSSSTKKSEPKKTSAVKQKAVKKIVPKLKPEPKGKSKTKKEVSQKEKTGKKNNELKAKKNVKVKAPRIKVEEIIKTEPVVEEVITVFPEVISIQPEIKKPEAFEEVKIESAENFAAAKDDKSKIADSKKSDNTIRVDVERLDNLVNIVSELVLGRNRLTQIHHDASLQFEGTKLAKDLEETSRHLDLMITELQLAVMKTRMVKIGKVFNKFPRLVRDLSKETKKNIQLVIHGEETELDKTLIEEINDPLVHLVRNSIDHGLELPEVREKLGKTPLGTITLSAVHEGNNISITIEDDGKGISPEVIINKAIEKGLITKEKAKELTKQEIYNLIFHPGFSTAEKVTNISGRGVGMDVVKTNVTKLRGIIQIESEINKGTKIIIKLPLTLAIIQGLLVDVHNEVIVVPLNSVIEVIKIMKNQIYTINGNEVIKFRDSVLPMIDVSNSLYNIHPNGKDKDWQYIVIVGMAERKYGLKVDKLVGQKEVVIKSLGSYLGNVNGIAGSSIMGDGKVVMILDLNELINNLKE